MTDYYAKLLNEGYIEEPIILDEPLSEMDLSEKPMGVGREDKGVVVTDPSGISMTTSSIMMGYNKRGIKLENGEYVSWEEVEDALDATMSEEAGEREVVFVCKKTGEIVDPKEIVSTVHEIATEKPYLYRSPSGVMKNQDSDYVSIFDKDVEYPKGVSMLGNIGIQLTSGEYVSREEVEQALQDYVMMVEPEREHEIIERFYRNFAWIPSLLTVVGLIISGFGKGDITERQVIERQKTAAIFNTTGIVETVDYDPSISDFETEHGRFTIGHPVVVGEGVHFYESSDYQYGGADQRGVIGTGSREAGTYTVDRFSVLYNGNIIEHEWQEGVQLFDLLEEKANELGVSVDDLQPMLHLGGPVTGWVNVFDVINSNNKDGHLDKVQVILDDDANYSGVVNDFSGDYITIDVDGEQVKLKVRNEDGSYVQSGDIVVGSDGKQYQMNNFFVDQSPMFVVQDVVVGSKVNWSVKNITDEEALAIGGMAAISAYLSLRKRKELVDMTDSEIDDFIKSLEEDFESKKSEFDEVSTFEEAAERLTGREVTDEISAVDILKEGLINQNITLEDVSNIGENSAGNRGKKN